MKQGDMTIQGQAAVLPKNDTGYFTYDISVTGSLAITGVGFAPTSMIFHSGINGAGGSFCCWHVSGTGISTTSCGGIASFHEETANNMVPVTAHTLVTGASTEARFSVQSFDTDGFTLLRVKSNSPTGTGGISFMAFK